MAVCLTRWQIFKKNQGNIDILMRIQIGNFDAFVILYGMIDRAFASPHGLKPGDVDKESPIFLICFHACLPKFYATQYSIV